MAEKSITMSLITEGKSSNVADSLLYRYGKTCDLYWYDVEWRKWIIDENNNKMSSTLSAQEFVIDRWFFKGKYTNAVYNEVDRHVVWGSGEHTAFILEEAKSNSDSINKSYKDVFVDSCLLSIFIRNGLCTRSRSAPGTRIATS